MHLLHKVIPCRIIRNGHCNLPAAHSQAVNASGVRYRREWSLLVCICIVPSWFGVLHRDKDETRRILNIAFVTSSAARENLEGFAWRASDCLKVPVNFDQ